MYNPIHEPIEAMINPSLEIEMYFINNIAPSIRLLGARYYMDGQQTVRAVSYISVRFIASEQAKPLSIYASRGGSAQAHILWVALCGGQTGAARGFPGPAAEPAMWCL